MTILEYIREKTGMIGLTNPNQLSNEEWYFYSVLKDIEEGKSSIKLPIKEIVKEVQVIKEIEIVKEVFVNDVPEARFSISKKTGRKKYTTSLPEKYKGYLNRANRKGLVFTLTVDQFQLLSSGTCIYCGEPATGIDRHDNSVCYTIENSRPCCGNCNWMKGTQTHEQFINRCKTIATKH